MCIHHLTYHAPCGHTSQKIDDIVKCQSVAEALAFYHNQPKEALRNRRGRCFTLEPMKMPKLCGASSIKSFRTITFVGQNRSITPEGWQPGMTLFARRLCENGEDVQSMVILLEAEYPQMADKVSEAWVRHLRSCFRAHGFLTWRPDTDLENEHLAGDIVTVSSAWGCGRPSTGNPRCFTNWDIASGGGLGYCPWIVSQDTRTRMRMVRPPGTHDDSSGGLSSDGGGDEFAERVRKEIEWQSRTFRWSEKYPPGLPPRVLPPTPPEEAYGKTGTSPSSGSGSCCEGWSTGASISFPTLEDIQRRASMPGQDLPSPAQSSFEEESDDSNNAIRGSDDSEEDKPALSTKTKGLCVIVSDGFPDENSHGRRESTVGKTGGKSSSVTCVEHCRENECEVCHEWGAESGLTLKTL